VVTGIGVIAPNGKGAKSFWESIRDGKSAAAPLTRFPPRDSPVRIACEVANFDPTEYIEPKAAKRLDRSIQFAVCAARQASDDASLDCRAIDPDRIGVVEGTSVSNNETAARAEEEFAAHGYRGVSLHAMINGYAGGGSGEVALKLGARGHAITLSTGSASGNDVMGYALGMIQNDEVDVMIAGGAEAPIIPSIWGTFCQGKVMSRHPGDPREAMRPFDASRDGFVLGEGAAFLVLEEMSHAIGRNARIYCELLAHGRACESYHPVAPHPDGIGILRAMDRAIHRARLQKTAVDYVNAHGTATEANDRVENAAIKKFFGPHARRIALSATKPVTGHLLAASGAIEAAVCALALFHQTIPPTINLKTPAPDCDLDYVSGKARPYPMQFAMSMNSGFGGKNACLLLGRFDPGR